MLALKARLVSDFEARIEPESDFKLRVNRGGRQTFRVTTRRIGEDGLRAPSLLEIPAPLRAEFLGEPVASTVGDELVETRRSIAVQLPPTAEAGAESSDLVVSWEDGTRRTIPIHWEVESPVHATPSGLVLDPGSETSSRSVFVRSADGPFRITDVSGESLAGPVADVPTTAALIHKLDLDLAMPEGAESSASDIRIQTDHPDCPTIVLSVISLPTSEGRR